MISLVAHSRARGPQDSPLGRCQVDYIERWSASQQHPCQHVPPVDFTPGTDIELSCDPLGASRCVVVLHYRHVNQAEPWQQVEMEWKGGSCAAVIPGAYTGSPFSLQYYFEVQDGRCAQFYPGLVGNLSNVPYFVLTGARRRVSKE
jgi:hypothetical protein